MSHSHEHGTPHSHTVADFGVAFAVGTVLNLGFVFIEVFYGVVSHSVSLLADAGHNFGDVLGLIGAWAAHTLAKRSATARFTYGLGSTTILAALLNAIALLVVTGGIGWEALRRFSEPTPVAGLTVMLVASAGVLVNSVSAWFFARGREGDLNIRGAFLHLISDAVVSAGVVVAGLLISVTGWLWVDPAASLLICVAVVFSTWGLLWDSVRMSLAGVPPGIDVEKIRQFLTSRPGVERVHDLHIWPLSTTEIAFTCHLVMPNGHPGDEFTLSITDQLHRDFGIGHSTLQIETCKDVPCALETRHPS
jgi:cobalt-zinc-cadmium efflux system protein